MAAFDAGSGIEFMAVARLSDGVVLASKAFASPTAYDFAGRVGQIAAAPALLTMIDQHGMVADGDHNLCLAFLDKPAYLLAAVISPDFPAKRRVLPSGTAPGQRLLSELAVAVQGTAGASLATAGPGGLNRALQPHFKQLYAKYMDANACGDKLGSVQEKVGEVRASLVSNMDKVLARGEKLEALTQKSEQLNSSAGQFQQGSTALRRAMQCRYYKVTAVLAVVVLAVLAYILVPIIMAETAK